MTTSTNRLLREAAVLLAWPERDLSLLHAELDGLFTDLKLLTDLKEWKQMQITQPQIDQLAAEIAGVKSALDDTNARVGSIQASLTTAQAEAETLKQQLADAGTPFDSSALDRALSDATSEAAGIGAAVAAAPVLSVPASPAATTADPAAATTANPAAGPAVGDTIHVPADPADPSGPTVPHTVTSENQDGTVTAVPADGSGGPSVTVDPATLPAAPAA